MEELALSAIRSKDYPKHCFCARTNPNAHLDELSPQSLETFDLFMDQVTANFDYQKLNVYVKDIFGHPPTLAMSFVPGRKESSSSSPTKSEGECPVQFTKDDAAAVKHVFKRLAEFDSFAAAASEGCEEAAGNAKLQSVSAAYTALLDSFENSYVLVKERYAALAVRFFMICLATPTGAELTPDFMVEFGKAMSPLSPSVCASIGRAYREVFGMDAVRNAVLRLTSLTSEWALECANKLAPPCPPSSGDDSNGGGDEERLRECGYRPWLDVKVECIYTFLDALHAENNRILSNGGGGGGDVLVPVKDSEWYNDGVSAANDFSKDYSEYAEKRLSFMGRHGYAIRLHEKLLLVMSEYKHAQKAMVQGMLFSMFMGRQGQLNLSEFFTEITVRRSHIVEDSLNQLESHPSMDFLKQLRVKFAGEDGVDAGGLRKEWFQLLTAAAIDPRYGMFTLSEKTRLFWLAGTSDALAEFRLIGKLVALAVYNGAILDLRFPLALYKKLCGVPVGLRDLRDVYPDVHAGLCALLAMPPEDVADLDLTFSAMENVYGSRLEKELCPGGGMRAVTAENRAEYVRLYTDYLLTSSVARQFDAFKNGFDSLAMLSKVLLPLFTPSELELAICGNPVMDWAALEEHTRYKEGYTKTTPVIRAFWRTFRGLTEEDKKAFLRFATGCDRSPAGGLKDIGLIIMRNGGDQDALPTAKTCFNAFLLPEYSSEDKLRAKFIQAIQCSTGFGLQ